MIHNLGDVSSVVAGAGARATSAIPYDGSVAFRMILTRSADYVLWCRYTGQDVSLEYSGPAGATEIEPGPAGAVKYFHLDLEAGQYTLSAMSDGDSPAWVDWDLLLVNGVGQSPTIAPRSADLVAFAAPGSQAVFNLPGASAQPSVPVGQTSSSSPSPGYSPATIASGLIQGRCLAGRPTSDVDPVPATGPTASPEGSPAGSLVGAMFGGRDEAGIGPDENALAAADRALESMAAGPLEIPSGAGEPAAGEPIGTSLADMTMAPTGPEGPEEGVDSDHTYAAWMLPPAGMAFSYCIRIRNKGESRGRGPSSWTPASRWARGNPPRRSIEGR